MRLSSFLSGQWVHGADPQSQLHDAVSGEVIAETSTRGLDLGAATAHARDVGGPALRAMTFAERADLLEAMSRSIHGLRDELIALSTQNYGATRSDGKFDVDGASGTLAYYASVGRKLGDTRILMDGEPERIGRSARFVGQHICVPRRGVAVHINAFNFPAWGMCEKLAVCLLAGMPAVVKPATATALVTWRVVRAWHEAGIVPDGVVSLLTGSAGDLLDHVASQDVVTFTGSHDTALKIRQHPQVVAANVPVNVEADSLNVAILGPDVEPGEPTFEMFLADVVRDVTQKAGQKCTAIRRVFVPADQLEEVQEGLEELIGDAPMGLPTARGVRVGPVATAAQHRDVLAGVETLASHFETLVEGVGDQPETGFYVRPRIFVTDLGAEAPMVHEHEVFGPVATVLTWDGDAKRVGELAALGGGGLVCSVYSDDAAWAGEAIAELAPFHGRIHWGSARVAGQSPGPGTVLPNLVHGGPGKAGAGEELGGLRGLGFYQQRTAVQADAGLLERALRGS